MTGKEVRKGRRKLNTRQKPKVGEMTVKQLDKHIKEVAVDSQKTQVQYFSDSAIEQNPAEGVGQSSTPIVFPIQPRGMDSLLPNYGTLTEGQRKIYIDYINIYVIFNENDLGVNDSKRNFIRHMLVRKDDETSASADDVRDMFKYMSMTSRVEESLNSIVPRSTKIYKFQDSDWIAYDAISSQSVSTGVVPGQGDLNYLYPCKKYKKTLKVQKEFQIADNGTLVDWSVPTLSLFFTGLATASPDCSMWYHLYYKVLA